MYQNWPIRDFSAGRIDRIDDNLIPDNAAKDTQNWIARKVGSLETRKGQTRLNATPLSGAVTGLHPAYYGSPTTERKLLVVANGLCGHIQSGAFTQLRAGLSLTEPTLFEDCVNYVVGFDGINQPFKIEANGVVSNLLVAPIDGRFPTLHKEKLFVVPRSEPSTLWWSESFQPEQWPADYYWNVKRGDGDEITGLLKYLGGLLIFKRRSTHYLSGTFIEDFQLREMDEKVGCVGPRAMTKHGLYAYHIAEDGIYQFNGMRSQNLVENFIPDLWETVNKSALHTAVAGHWDGLLWFAVPEGQSTTPNLLLLFVPNEESGGAWFPCRGINPTCLTRFDDGTSVKLYAGDSLGYVNRQWVGTADFGQNISAYWIGKHFDMGMASVEKKARKLFVEDFPGEENKPDIALSFDYGAFNNAVFRRGDTLAREYRVTQRARWRYVAPRISYTGTEGCSIRGLLLPYKPKSRPKVKGTVGGGA